ncbi:MULTISPECIES: NAD(P)/FAD-dependent oxidoreductase [Variovorax]|jgi:sarcosine oxidase, subunit beta|uniref:NAD(P)/FAD-dependent oxidoreductase n=1 Tax=Variovorax TaxID=34072 RepID=UPI00086F0569|nr:MULTISPECIES: FAD-binding oxidoreductase [Variovorax]MBN8754233.1 FAD-binding oxidoreductase [Variovorax sp.]ODU18530.1 MAG: FAD-dependent oxidoreductase [Variovorax sp. SCN 67-85]ODV25487.1 MAG: FAD-dependent oxidoreductase [Variovorax sp. SCN 67-20]OJZ05017.1 MAG: FAD-dependent oxidoreductase [Variovorax sp. 67-131]UKI09063.1 FAD-binding oxidoreductase [Variovorax paradoxus]
MSGIRKLQTEVAIVGGGIVGSSAALALRHMGIDVVLLERDFCGSRSSGVNFGGVRRQGRPVSQLPLAQRAHRIWGRLPELLGTDGEYLRSGHFKIARSEADMASLERYRALSSDFDLGLELISAARLRAQCPWLGTRAVGGSLCIEDGQANPRLVSPAFALAAARAGAQVFERHKVDEVAHDGALFTVRSTHADGTLEVQAPVLLNCAGAWASAIAGQFGEMPPLSARSPLMAVTEPVPRFMTWSLGVEGGGIYCRQVERGNLVLGGGTGITLDADRARAERDGIATLAAQAVELLPALRHAHIIRTWGGTEGYLPDRQPVLGASRTTPGLFHGFGFSGAGFQIGPAAGEVLAELARDGRSDTPIDAFAIERFDEAPVSPSLAASPT